MSIGEVSWDASLIHRIVTLKLIIYSFESDFCFINAFCRIKTHLRYVGFEM